MHSEIPAGQYKGHKGCHGPGKAHVDKPKVDNIINPARLSTERSIDVCLSCHQSGKPDGDEYAWAVGYREGQRSARTLIEGRCGP